MITIGLIWHDYPSENLGVGALTHSHLLLIGQALDALGLQARLQVFGMDPEQDGMLEQVSASPYSYTQISLRRLFSEPGYARRLVARVAGCDLLFDLSAGDSFTDIYGAKRLAQQCFTKFLALAAARPLVLCPQTVGPFDTGYGRLLSGLIVKRCRKVFVRDQLSLDYLGRAGLERHAELVTDLAFALPYDPLLYPRESGALQVGVNVSGLLLNGGYTGANQFAMKMDYPGFIRELLGRLSAKPGVVLHLVPHVISELYEVEDDYRACRQLALEFPQCRLAPRFRTPSQAKSYIANLDFFTGARMHATIAAFSSGVPVVPVAYSRKFAGLFGSLGYHCLVDGKAHDGGQALEIVLGGLENRAGLAREVQAGRELAASRLARYRDFLSEAFRAVQRG